MSVKDLLTRFRRLGVTISLEEGNLRLKAPKGVLTAELRAELSERKEAVIAFLRKTENAARQLSPGLQPVPRQERMPLSFAQQRLWFLDQWEPGNPELNIPGAMHLTGELDAELLEKCLVVIIQRHESLRTIFGSSEGKPFQTIQPAAAVKLTRVNLADLSPTERESRLQKLTIEQVHHRFDLSAGPLFYFLLIKLGEHEWLFMFIFHHIITDGWSIGIFTEELSALYAAFCHNKPAPLTGLPVQYADFAVWQRDWLTGEVMERQLSYWKKQLGDNPPTLEFPTDFQRPAVQSGRGDVYSTKAAKKLTAALFDLANKEQCTVFMVLLTGFNILLSRYSGQKEIIVGSPTAGRNRREIEGVIGFFLNSLALRTDLSGDPQFVELLDRVKDTTLEAYAHQDIPFEKLLEELAPQRDLSRTPFFQVFFNMLNMPGDSLTMPGLAIEGYPLPIVGSKFDFTIYLFQKSDGFLLKSVFSMDLFTRERMVEMMEQYKYILEQAAANPRTTVSGFSLVAPHDEAILLDLQQPLDDTWYGSVQEMFAKKAAENPRYTAVVDKDEHWTYGELNALANRLASYLTAQGVDIHDAVAIYGHRSAPLVWGILGILKAGAAFVILDPAYPASRSIDYLRLAKPKGFLQVEAAGKLPPVLSEFLASSSIVCRLALPARAAAGGEDFLSGYSSADPAVTVGQDDIACITFTSGSSGIPKGVMGRHGSLTHFLPWQQETFGISAADRFSMLSGLAHDPLQRDIFTSLCSGASLHIPDPQQIGMPGRLHAWMSSAGITISHLTPAMLQLIIRDAPGGELLPLRYAFTVGDVLTRRDVADLKRLAPRVTFINLYGATETQRAVGYFIVPGNVDELRKEVIPLGRGVPDTQLLVLNEHNRLAGIGELGEICIRSPHLALGYLGDEDLTHTRFITNPFTQQSSDRIYRTGDSGRYLPDGCIEFQGRMDFQVKIHGFRIEPGEVETALVQYPGIREVVVLLHEVQSDDRRLAAYFVPTETGGVKTNELHDFAAKKLPDFMVPSFFIELAAFPLTPNGKIDRKALPAPTLDREKMGVEFIAPRTAAEEIMVKIWREILRVEKIGVRDNFFQLGGHSLLATQVVSRIRDEFKIELPVRTIFESPLLAQLAEIVESKISSKSAIPTLEPMMRGRMMPLSFAQQRLWFLDQYEPDTAVYNIYHALRLIGRLGVGVLESTFNEIIRRHEPLRTVFSAEAGKPFQVVSPAGVFVMPVVDLSGLPAADRENRAEQMAIEEANRPFNLSAGPLFRVTLLHLDETVHFLLLTIHHIVSDGWSMGVLISEMKELYSAFYEGRPSPLPELAVQYADFAIWQRQWLSGEILETQLSYWRERLSGELPVLELPTDYPRPVLQTFAGKIRSFELGVELRSKLNKLAQQCGATLFMTLLAAFKVLLNRYTDLTDIAVGTPIANRSRSEIEGLIGFFINTLTLRTDLSGNPTFQELLSRVRETALGAYAHQDVPFEMLVDILSPQRDLRHSPLFQVLFALQNMPAARLELPDLTVEFLDLGRETAKFDLSIYMYEHEEGLWGRLEYNTDLFSEATIDRFIGHFRTLLESVVSDMQQNLSELTISTDEERRQLLVKWNDTRADYPGEKCIHELFEAWVEKAPDRTAAAAGEAYITYGELNVRANRIACYLRSSGVREETWVGVCLERSLELIAVLLGIFKAGGFYVPLDPGHPGERLASILEDTPPADPGESPLLLSMSRFSGLFSGDKVKPVFLDKVGSQIEDLPGTGVSAVVCADNLAYTIFTSGSTGRPKGVQIVHRGVVNFLNSMSKVPGLNNNDILLSVTTLSFDISVLEIFLPLSVGAYVVSVDPETAADGGALLKKLSLSCASVMQATPATWRLLLAAGWLRADGLRVLCGGEELTPGLAVELLSRGVSLWNVYGPTETTVWSAVFKVEPGFKIVSIGRPIDNTELYILDSNLNPAPVGVYGELYIGGDGVSRGYLNRPGLTAERFIPHPFSSEGKRLYRTGDLVRFMSSGAIEFSGRVDFQVKVRGFRIELGEIEAALLQHPVVSAAVVVLRGEQAEDKQLAAYYVGTTGSVIGANELRQYLAEKLPGYMVPSFFVELAVLPLTPNGKIDRKALPAPDRNRQDMGVEYIAPRTAAEKIIVKIWQEILRVEKIGVRDNFFQLGGHSLLATQIISRIRDEFDIELPVRSIFESPVAARLAEIIDSKISEKSAYDENTITFDTFEEGKL